MYWQYSLIHTYNMLTIYNDPHTIMEGVTNVYDLKSYTQTKNTYYESRRYLGTNFGKFLILDGSGSAWLMFGNDMLRKQ